MIPEGWQQKELGELVTFKSGGTPSKEVAKYWNVSGLIPLWIKLPLKVRKMETQLSQKIHY
jgi:hypothetical protein